MKRIIFPAIGATLFFTFSPFALAGGPEILPVPDYFNGAYVGFIGGLHEAAIDSSSLINVPENITVPTGFEDFAPEMIIMAAGSYADSDKNGYSFDGYYGVQGGLGKVFDHRWYLGVVGFGEWGSQDSSAKMASSFGTGFVIEDNAQVHGENGTVTSTVTTQIENDYGVAAKFGYLLAPKTMAYAKIGVIWANIKVSNQQASDSAIVLDIENQGVLVQAEGQLAGSSSNSDVKAAYLFGGGVEQYIYKDIVSLNIEYDYANFGTVKTPLTNLVLNGGGSTTINGEVFGPETISNEVTSATTQASGSAKISMLMAGLNVHFGSNWF